MEKSCKQCSAPYEVTNEDLAFLDKVSPVFAGKKELLPPPSLCYDCRQQRRLAMRNERNLYKRTCDLCKRAVISIYAPDTPHTVYCPECWWGDGWDPLSYGRPYDPARPFFAQFGELYAAIPKMSTFRMDTDINSDYTHDGYRLKNCYFIFDGEQAQDCYFGEQYVMDKDCCDFLFLTQSELCYECIYCQECFNLRYSRFCQKCSDSAFLLDCVGCKNCIACANLVHKEYQIFNEQLTKEEFEQRKASFNLHTASGVAALRKQAEAFFLTKPRKTMRGAMNEGVSGDNLNGCKDTSLSFDCMGMRDCRHCTNCMMGVNDSQDVDAWGDRASLLYNCAYVGAGVQNLIGCFYVGMGASDILYSLFCMTGASHFFGCVAMKKADHCILNRKYTKEEYERLVPQIIGQMRKDGTWGSFFSPDLSAFAYNETVAQDYYPITREEVLKRGWKWRDAKEEVPDVKKVIDAVQLPDSIDDIPDDILNWAIRPARTEPVRSGGCGVSGKPFKIQKSELDLYRRMRVPVPRRHFEVRHKARFAFRNPRKLWDRSCAKCGKAIQTSYSPDRSEIVYCEDCYLKEVY